MPDEEKKDSVRNDLPESLSRRWLRFLLASGALLLVVFGLAPLPLEHFGPLARYADGARQNDIHPGALYYTDVSVSRQAELHSRDTVRYFYDLPRERKQD